MHHQPTSTRMRRGVSVEWDVIYGAGSSERRFPCSLSFPEVLLDHLTTPSLAIQVPSQKVIGGTVMLVWRVQVPSEKVRLDP